MKISLTAWILIAMATGITLGWWVNTHAGAGWIHDFLGVMTAITDIFLRLIKMIIAPLVFSTLVVGIAKLGDIRAVGRIGGKTLLWFMGASLLSLLLGLVVMHSLQLGSGLNLATPAPGAAGAGTGTGTGVDPSGLSLQSFYHPCLPAQYHRGDGQ